MKTITPEFCDSAIEARQASSEEPAEIKPAKDECPHLGSEDDDQSNNWDEDESSDGGEDGEKKDNDWDEDESPDEEDDYEKKDNDWDEDESPDEEDDYEKKDNDWDEDESPDEEDDYEKKDNDWDEDESSDEEDDYGRKDDDWDEDENRDTNSDKVHQWGLDNIEAGNYSPEVMGLLARSSLGFPNPLNALESFALSLMLANAILNMDALTSLLGRSDWLSSLGRLGNLLSKLPLDKLKGLLAAAMKALDLAGLESLIKSLEKAIPALAGILDVLEKALVAAVVAAEIAHIKQELEKALNELKALAASQAAQAAQEAAAKAQELAGQGLAGATSAYASSGYGSEEEDEEEDLSNTSDADDEEDTTKGDTDDSEDGTGEEDTTKGDDGDSGHGTAEEDAGYIEDEEEDDDAGSPAVESPLVGQDESNNAYEVTYMEVQEEISQPFIANATIIAEEIDCTSFLGKPFHIYYEPDSGSHKHKEFIIHGIVTAVTNLSTETDDAEKKVLLQLKPWLSLLGYKTQCQIFQNVDLKQIIDELCSKYAVSMPFEFQSSTSCQKRTFCAQINETDFDFVTRLLAEEGFYYYFKHTESSHTLVIGSEVSDFLKFEGEDFEYIAVSDDESKSLSIWSAIYEVHNEDVTLQGYSRETSDPFVGQSAKSKIDAGTISGANTFIWDSSLPSQDEGDKLSLTIAGQRDSAHQIISAACSVPLIRAGMVFKLGIHSDESQEGEYFIRGISHIFMEEKVEYQNTFVCTSSSYPFKAQLIEKPRMYGIQTACVSGPDNEEVYTDGKGCVKVRFHWDLSDTKGDSCSAWVPVVQSIAGEKFGVYALPRVGQEVLINFIDNDPDQPIVIGCLYNAKNEAPNSEEYLTSISTRSIPNGQEGHEIRLNDKKDEEEVYVKSQKDLLLNVTNDMSVVVTGEQKTQVEKDQTIEVKKNHSLKADEKIEQTSGKDFAIDCGTDLKVTCKSSAKYESTGSTSISGSDVKIEGKSGITLKCGGCEVSLSPSGVTIKAPTISVEAQTSLSLKGLTAEMQANTACSVKGQAAVIIKGGITQIN